MLEIISRAGPDKGDCRSCCAGAESYFILARMLRPQERAEAAALRPLNQAYCFGRHSTSFHPGAK